MCHLIISVDNSLQWVLLIVTKPADTVSVAISPLLRKADFVSGNFNVLIQTSKRLQGEWDISTSGFLFENWGSWKIDGLDSLLLAKKEVAPKPYRIHFKNDEGGIDLYLIDDEGQFTVLSRCD